MGADPRTRDGKRGWLDARAARVSTSTCHDRRDLVKTPEAELHASRERLRSGAPGHGPRPLGSRRAADRSGLRSSAENHITEGMKTLLTEGFRRLEGKSAQGVFKLTQAMGGGKTHNLLALGLLARHPEFRGEVMGDFYRPRDIGPVRVVAFSGRESDAPLGVWGAVAEQLGRREHFKDYYAPLSAPGQTAWVNLLQGDPLVIMLDELPPYLVNAAAKSIGNSDLAVVTATALANLLVAIGRDELHNVCLVLSDLTASYAAGSQQIVGALRDLERETGRTAMNLEPVRMNTDEFYQILRKRIFETLPPDDEVEEVAQGYAQAVRDAKQMDVTNASPESFAARIVDSYPFHPSIRDLYARFRENQGFQQTRGLIRLMRIVVARIWESGRDPHLIAAHDIDLADRETLAEINHINPTLENAIAHDIASAGGAVAEVIDANLGAARTPATSCGSSWSPRSPTCPGRSRGWPCRRSWRTCARRVATYLGSRTRRSRASSWPRGTCTARATVACTCAGCRTCRPRQQSTAGAYLRDQATAELRSRLVEIFKPVNGWCYQRLAPLPPVDEIDPSPDRVTLVVSEPHPSGLHPDLVAAVRTAHLPQPRLLSDRPARVRLAARPGARDQGGQPDHRGVAPGRGSATATRRCSRRASSSCPRFVAQFHSARARDVHPPSITRPGTVWRRWTS